MIGRRAWTRAGSLAYLAVVYAVALGIAWLVAQRGAGLGDWQAVLLADAAATGFVFLAAFTADNTSVYDPYWSVAPLPMALWWAARGAPNPVRFAVVAGLIAFWAIRLTANFLHGWGGLGHEDWRYTEYRRLGKAGYWAVSLLGLQSIPTLVVFTAMLPVLAITRSSGNPFGWLDGAAAIVTTAAVALETIADEQKGRHPGDGFLAAGVWAWVRHPNYLGEIAFWWGLYLFGLAAGWSNWWTVIGPAAMTLLFVFVSVPLMDRRMERRPGYVEYRRRVPALLPRMRGRG